MFRKFVSALASTVVGLATLSSVVQARDSIRIVGSSTVFPFATVVAEKLGSRGKYKTPVVESTGTGGGMKLFCAGVGVGHPDFTNASRAIKKSELKLCQQNGVSGIIEIIIGNDGIAFANSVKSGQANFTLAQLWMAMAEYGPKPSRWNEIDASFPDVAIKILAPPPTSGTRDAWNDLVMKGGCKVAGEYETLRKKCAIFREDGAVEEAGENDTLIVRRLSADPAAFGIFGFSFLDMNGDRIQGSTIEGVAIALDTIQTHEYPVSRPLFFYAKKAHIGAIPGMQDYLNEFVSESAVWEYGYLSDIGLVPLEPQQLAEIRKRIKNLTTL
ncbi:MAG: substrate-binding domain-containing protein [SAR324 cluster bacterium]|jgi:phosphate transport system substrate-binding protein|nr:substrate-binding domain-containing protein [SAR324 cluster bacterium]